MFTCIIVMIQCFTITGIRTGIACSAEQTERTIAASLLRIHFGKRIIVYRYTHMRYITTASLLWIHFNIKQL